MNVNEVEVSAMERDWEAFLAPYEQTVSELKVKLRGIRKQFREQNRHVPIEFVTGRVKPVDSIVTKSQLRHIPMGRLEEEMSDIAGLRIMCQFVEDIHQVVEIIRKRKDMKVLQERDYITNKKASGYRSYHLVIEYPVQLISGEKKILAEIQIRTLAMNFWASTEHQLRYKKDKVITSEMHARLKKCADIMADADYQMQKLAEEIHF
mgnify:CR=1 FL=1